MITATKARQVFLKNAKKTVAKTIRQAVKNGKPFVTLTFSEESFKVAPSIRRWLESMGYSAKSNEKELTMLVCWL